MRKIIDGALIFVSELKSRGDPAMNGYENFEGNQFNIKSIRFSTRNNVNYFKFETDLSIDEIWDYDISAMGYVMTVAYPFC